MTLHRIGTPMPAKPARQTISRGSRSMGIYLLASRGTGKSRLLGRKIAMEDFLAGIPQVVLDPIGATIDNFLDKAARYVRYIPKAQRHRFWQRICYIDLSGKDRVITPFPLYFKLGTEQSLLEIAERYLQVIIKSNPALYQAQVLGWPPLHRIGVNTGMVLAALGYQITEAESLLRYPEQWENRFDHAIHNYPEVAPAVSFFKTEYIPMREQDRRRLTTPFFDKLFPFTLDPVLRAMFGATKPGIDWSDVARNRQTVLLDFRHVQDTEKRRFELLWVFSYLYEWIKTRGRSEPFGLIIDEFAHLTQNVVSGQNPLASELDEFINVYMRQHSIWFTAAHQELYQLDTQLRNTLLSLGTYILGSTSSMESARELADALFLRDPYWVKHYRKQVTSIHYANQPTKLLITEEPEFMRLEEQREVFAQRIRKLGLFRFLLRPALAEGHIGSAVIPISIRDVDRDTETGQYFFPEQHLVARLRSALAKQSGMPLATLLQEQEARVLPAPASRGAAKRQGTARHRSPAGSSEEGNFSDGTGTASDPATPAPEPPRRTIQRRSLVS